MLEMMDVFVLFFFKFLRGLCTSSALSIMCTVESPGCPHDAIGSDPTKGRRSKESASNIEITKKHNCKRLLARKVLPILP